MNPGDGARDPRAPRGFRFGAAKAGIKASGNTDVAVAVSNLACTAAAAFTTNQFCAAPLVVGKQHLAAAMRIQAVVINAGNANCATGQQGIEAARETCDMAARHASCLPVQVFPSSTGIIGVPLPVEKLTAALPAAFGDAGATLAHIEAFSRAIMTTDTVPKVEARSLRIGGKDVRILGFAKGAGMIHPQLQMAGPPHATMLVYLFTDLEIPQEEMDALLHGSIESSFNSISIDGDTSTNDTVLFLANGASGAQWSDTGKTGHQAFASALQEVCTGLARRIVADGEGVRHVIEIQVTGARTTQEARTVAKLLAHSPLVKTAWAGEDPNWGRLVSAIGAGPVAIHPNKLTLAYGPNPVFEAGGRAAGFDAAAIHNYLQQPEYILHVSLGLGEATTRFWTTDLTAEYVRINADYST